MKTQLRWMTIVCALLLLGADRVAAQEIAGTFDQLRVLVTQGDTITVTNDAGSDIAGTIADLSPSSLALLVDGRRHDLQASDINTIQQRRSDSLANGAKWGFGIGAALGLVAAVTVVNIVDESGYAVLVFVPLSSAEFQYRGYA